MIMLIYIIVFAVVLHFLFYLLQPERDKHRIYQKKARKILKDIQSKERPDGQIINYLRTINPYVFEELVLSAFEKSGYTIKRNKRYSGDGGIDGRMSRDGTKYLIQCKRYRWNIHQSDVEEFDELCEKKKTKGFFVHTGKTGDGARQAAQWSDNVTIISGSKLVRLLKGENA